MEEKFEGFEQSLREVRDSTNKLEQKQDTMQISLTTMSDTIQKLEKRLKLSEDKCEQIESQSRRENLKFYGFPEKGTETWEDTETIV